MLTPETPRITGQLRSDVRPFCKSDEGVVLLFLAFLALAYVASSQTVVPADATPKPFLQVGTGEVCIRSCQTAYSNCNYQQTSVCYIRYSDSIANITQIKAAKNLPIQRKDRIPLLRVRKQCVLAAYNRCAANYFPCTNTCPS